jgi:hypothetical protein
MLHYLINSSIVWLVCLVLYDIWLRKESFHQYNRIYLLASLVAGLIIPAVSLNNMMSNNTSHSSYPIEQVYQIKKVMQSNQIEDLPVQNVLVENPFTASIWWVYFVGILIGIILLLWEIYVLYRFYIKGRKSYDQDCIIIETDKNHCPFSLFNIVFIRSRVDYNQVQWDILIAHEKEHNLQFHVFDNLGLIILRIIFWFNPLVYIFFKKLRIVHEFQADKAAATNPTFYGTFLIEQNLLQGAPTLTHSFNYSPIKTRIAMLTQTSSKPIKQLKYLGVLPLLLILIVFCTQTSFTGQIHIAGKKINVKGNEIEFGELRVIPYEYQETMRQHKKMFLSATLPDSFPVMDYASGQIIRMEPIVSKVIPVKINGKPIYGNETHYWQPDENMKYTIPMLSTPEKDLEQIFFAKLKNELSKLEDGYYTFRVNDLVIDEQGKVAYFESRSIDALPETSGDYPKISNEVKEQINQTLEEILNGFDRFKPALKNGKAINVRLSLGNYEIKVKNHQAKLVERAGC